MSRNALVFLGGLIAGLATTMICGFRKGERGRQQLRPPVQQLADELNQAWGDRHTP